VTEQQCPTCGQEAPQPVPRDHCVSCGVELEDVFNNPSCKQYKDALEVHLSGGYGMFFDNFDGDHHVFLCGDCALAACMALPWLNQLMKGRAS
jgi:hypothetical protein